jgi:hypothetical protein
MLVNEVRHYTTRGSQFLRDRLGSLGYAYIQMNL